MKYALMILLITFTSHAESLREKFKARLQKKNSENVSSVPSPGLLNNFKITHDNRERLYSVFVPDSYDPKRPSPLLFVFHGGGGSMKIQSTDRFYRQISKSREQGFIAVFPNGYSKFPSGMLATWNAGKCCGEARDKNVDDVGFIKVIFGILKKQLNIDSNRIFAAGMSNGAMMSYRLACEMPDTFKAIAAVAGTDNTQTCENKKVSVLHIHAKDDDHVLYNGGIGPAAVKKSKITDFNSVPSTISKWVKINGCSDQSKKLDTYCEEYSACQENKKVRLCVTPAGGHSWPGGQKPRGTSEPFSEFSATDAMWAFFNSL